MLRVSPTKKFQSYSIRYPYKGANAGDKSANNSSTGFSHTSANNSSTGFSHTQAAAQSVDRLRVKSVSPQLSNISNASGSASGLQPPVAGTGQNAGSGVASGSTVDMLRSRELEMRRSPIAASRELEMRRSPIAASTTSSGPLMVRRSPRDVNNGNLAPVTRGNVHSELGRHVNSHSSALSDDQRRYY